MTSERSLWLTTRAHLSPFGRLVRVETPGTGGGVPDVVYCLVGRAGWLELKELDTWPVRPTTKVRIDHLTLEQVLFLEGWEAAGGSAHLLLQVGRQYLLLPPKIARAVHARELTRVEVEAAAVVNSTGKFPRGAVLRALGVRVRGADDA